MRGHLEREAKAMCPDGGRSDIGDKVVIKVKRCSPIAVNSKLVQH